MTNKILINKIVMEDLRIEIPPLEICKGKCKELILLNSGHEQPIADKIVQIAESQGDFITYANQLSTYRHSILDSILQRKAGDIVAKVSNLEKTKARHVCKISNISPDEDFGPIQLNEKKILDLEVCALKSDFIIVNDYGHDPVGIKKLSEHIEKMIHLNAVGILFLKVPIINRSKEPRWDNPVRVSRLID